MNRFLFLDFDGVLNSYRSDLALVGINSNPAAMNHMFDAIDPKFDTIAVNLVRKLVELTNAKIVISSSWRKFNTIDILYYSFDYYEWDTRNIMIDCTPILYRDRGHEIAEWLQKNAKEPYKYVILDDGYDMLPEQRNNFVQTDPAIGFSYDDFNKALEILK